MCYIDLLCRKFYLIYIFINILFWCIVFKKFLINYVNIVFTGMRPPMGPMGRMPMMGGPMMGGPRPLMGGPPRPPNN